MSRHVWVNQARLTRGRRVEGDPEGFTFEVDISPYSMPHSVTGDYSPKTGVFTIEFRYIDRERSSQRIEIGNEGIVIREGVYSRKILAIEIPVKADRLKDISFIEMKIKKAFQLRIGDVNAPIGGLGHPDLLNQEVADEILGENLVNLVGN